MDFIINFIQIGVFYRKYNKNTQFDSKSWNLKAYCEPQIKLDDVV